MKIVLMIFLTVCANFAFTQQTKPEIISSAGKHFSNSNISINWTIGEAVISTENSGINILTQGFHQSNYIISVINNNQPKYHLSVFPNPTSDYLTLQVENEEKIQIELFDKNGKQVLRKSGILKSETINMLNFTNSTYILCVYNHKNQLIKSFKILKQ